MQTKRMTFPSMWLPYCVACAPGDHHADLFRVAGKLRRCISRCSGKTPSGFGTTFVWTRELRKRLFNDQLYIDSLKVTAIFADWNHVAGDGRWHCCSR
jgi:hypothetical protein